MELKLIGRGVLAGALGGLLAYVFARIFAEPVIGQAIDYESGRDAAQHKLDLAQGLPVAHEGHEIFTRTIQGWVGIGAGLVLFGAAMGALFAVAYAVCLGRTGRVRPRQLALLVAAAGFVLLYLVPFVKYPANPPAIGHEETIRARSELYIVTVFCSVLFGFLAVYVGQKLAARWGSWRATLLAGAGFVVLMAVVMLVLPPLGHLHDNVVEYGRHRTETPLPLRDGTGRIVFPGFNADLLYRFRLYSVGAQLILWTTIGLVFAPLAERLLQPPGTASKTQSPQSPAPVTS
ncbi:cobalt transporter [Nocardioides mangrovicus]|uniref:Cobalt transporter n=1 Tax=Nocardioides mangrovicus TaxID=2478913 RepID=A0A3L8P5N9_9ACTN|nr:CbtA family protein [Nocardioides mangrovicus]RLV50384.1 cobalt transporter [Nocardioides mangrovicus]